jgi:hypothetical protein
MGSSVPIQNEYQKELQKKKRKNYLLLKNVYFSPRSSSPENFSLRPEIKKVFRYFLEKYLIFNIPLLWIRIRFTVDLDPAFYLNNTDPDPGAKLLRIRIQGAKSMWIWVQGAKSMWMHVDKDPVWTFSS